MKITTIKFLKNLQKKAIVTALASVTAFTYSFASASVMVSPVHIAVPEHTKSASVNLTNDSDDIAIMDIRIMKWIGQNEDGSNILEATDSVISSKPVVTIKPHSSTTIRFIVKARSGEAEDAYRVSIADISESTKSSTVGMKVSSNLPMFVLKDKNSHGYLELKDGVLTNAGNRHVRIAEYTNKNGKKVNLLRYVMPNNSIKLPVKSASDIVQNDDIY